MLRVIPYRARSRVLAPLWPCFTAPTFEVLDALVTGLLAQPVGQTVCGMLAGAGLPPCGITLARVAFFRRTRGSTVG